ncbi:MAG TPA: methionyl-tRNA formyltransferase [Pseudonocardiaceae bacterium]|jgi:methionyl-tRNA formyltransferase|nr:methionyl-tRNA formyltransferase [Pseudonocardiaceae bacterium]
MRLVFAGTPIAAVPSLRALLDSPDHEVVAVLTRPDAPSGRGQAVHRSPVGTLADEHGIEVLTPRKAGAPDFLARLAELAPDCCPVVAYGALLPTAALAIPQRGWVNLHFSLLPAWRGAAPVQAAVKHGDEITGATTFQIVKELDAGPTFGMVTVAVGAGETAGELLSRLAVVGAQLLVDTVDGIAQDGLRAQEQPADGVSYAPKVTVDDAHVDFAAPAPAVDRLLRSVTPDPGGWAVFREERIKLAPVTCAEAGIDPVSAGELLVQRKRVLVGTASGPVVLSDVQAAGKKRMAATDWARGTRIEPGERLT